MGYKGRDIEISKLDDSMLLIAACDSCGGIGEKAFDEVKAPAELVGRMTTRVALMELISVGAIPKLLTVSISSEPEPTGVNILSGIETELMSSELGDLPRIISTEKNITTCQTALGIGATGVCLKEDLRINRSEAGDYVYCLGYPKVGKEFKSPDDSEIVQISDLKYLINQAEVHDILPIGSSGILAETSQLADQVGCRFCTDPQTLDLLKSAGPSTCAIFTGPEAFSGRLSESLPLTKIGSLISI